MKHVWMSAVASAAILAGCSQSAEDGPKTQEPATKAANPASDVPGYPTKRAFFGDLHIHTKNSFDAYIFNVRSTPEDVYRFALGESVRHPSGYDIQLDGPPLDFVAATDHGAYMGILPEMNNPDSPLSKLEIAQGMFGTDPEVIIAAFGKIGGSVRTGIPFEEVYDRDIIDNTWQNTVATADQYYVPGELTTFAGYEFTSVKSVTDEGFIGANLHRNVIFKDAAPNRLFATLDSPNPEDLWDWMDGQRSDGRDVIAIPHNSNVSDGLMFDLKTYEGGEIDRAYSEQRLRNEPIVEMTQVKGTSETHPSLSPNDEFANFEIYEKLLSSYQDSKVDGSYVRQALARGMDLEKRTGTNPYKFGMIGSSDTHVAGGAFSEKDYWSKVGIVDGTPEARGSVPPGGAKTWEGVERDANAESWFSRWSASGYAVVWAESNTREAIFDAMRRRETYATSGPRFQVRMFAGDYDESILDAGDMIEQAYARGVPMGSDAGVGDSFLVWATRAPDSAPLDRVQIIKTWHDGKPRERIYDVACADGREPGANYRCAASPASVDLDSCEPSRGEGAAELKAVWSDPRADEADQASYYVRVIANPTCRWTTWEANRAGVERHPDVPATLTERAWTSPIWVRK